MGKYVDEVELKIKEADLSRSTKKIIREKRSKYSFGSDYRERFLNFSIKAAPILERKKLDFTLEELDRYIKEDSDISNILPVLEDFNTSSKYYDILDTCTDLCWVINTTGKDYSSRIIIEAHKLMTKVSYPNKDRGLEIIKKFLSADQISYLYQNDSTIQDDPQKSIPFTSEEQQKEFLRYSNLMSMTASTIDGVKDFFNSLDEEFEREDIEQSMSWLHDNLREEHTGFSHNVVKHLYKKLPKQYKPSEFTNGGGFPRLRKINLMMMKLGKKGLSKKIATHINELTFHQPGFLEEFVDYALYVKENKSEFVDKVIEHKEKLTKHNKLGAYAELANNFDYKLFTHASHSFLQHIKKEHIEDHFNFVSQLKSTVLKIATSDPKFISYFYKRIPNPIKRDEWYSNMHKIIEHSGWRIGGMVIEATLKQPYTNTKELMEKEHISYKDDFKGLKIHREWENKGIPFKRSVNYFSNIYNSYSFPWQRASFEYKYV